LFLMLFLLPLLFAIGYRFTQHVYNPFRLYDQWIEWCVQWGEK